MISIEGLPGVGKTTVAAALANHARILNHFSDGVLWGSLGPRPNPTAVLSKWATAMGAESKELMQFDKAEFAKGLVGQLLGRHKVLVVIDDAWSFDSASLLRCGGPECKYVLTTRDKSVAREFSDSVRVRTLSCLTPADALRLFQDLAPEAYASNPEASKNIVEAVGRLPLAISLTAGYLSDPRRSMFPGLFPDLKQSAFNEVSDPKNRLKLVMNRVSGDLDEVRTLKDVIALSLEGLKEHEITAFHSLGTFAPKPSRFSVDAAKYVTQAESSVLALLVSRNLVEGDEQTLKLTLHQIIHEFAEAGARPDAIARHSSYYLSQAKARSTERVWVMGDNYEQIQRAWRRTPVGDILLEWLSAMNSYFTLRGLWEDFLEWNLRALDWAATQERKTQQAKLLADIGRAYSALGRWQEALLYFERALSVFQVINDAISAGRSLHNIGIFHHKLGAHQTGLRYLQDARSRLQVAGDRKGVLTCVEHLIVVLLALDQIHEADLCRLERDAILSSENRGGGDNQSEVHLVEASVTRPIYLTMLEYAFNIGCSARARNDPELHGKICVAVIGGKEGSRPHYMIVKFFKGGSVSTDYADSRPFDVDAYVEVDEDDTVTMLYKGVIEIVGKPTVALPREGEPFKFSHIWGDTDLLGRAFKSLCEGAEAPQTEQDAAIRREQLTCRAGTLMRLGFHYGQLKQYALAINYLDKAAEVLKPLSQEFPDPDISQEIAYCLNGRGEFRYRADDGTGAIADCEAAISISKQIVESNDFTGDRYAPLKELIAQGLTTRGRSYVLLGDVRRGLLDYDEAIAIFAPLVNQHQDRVTLVERLASALEERSKAFDALGDPANWLRDYSKAADLRIDLIRQEHKAPEMHVAAHSMRIGLTLHPQGKFAEAARRFSEAIEICDALSKAERDRKIILKALRVNLMGRASSYHALSLYAEAVIDYTRCIDLLTESADQGVVEESAGMLLDALERRYHALDRLECWGEAISDLKRAIDLCRRRLKENGDAGSLADSLSSALINLAWILATCRRSDIRDGIAAVEFATEACEMNNWQSYEACDSLAAAYAQSGNFAQAVRCQFKAIGLAPPNEVEDSKFRLALYEKGRPYTESMLLC